MIMMFIYVNQICNGNEGLCILSSNENYSRFSTKECFLPFLFFLHQKMLQLQSYSRCAKDSSWKFTQGWYVVHVSLHVRTKEREICFYFVSFSKSDCCRMLFYLCRRKLEVHFKHFDKTMGRTVSSVSSGPVASQQKII